MRPALRQISIAADYCISRSPHRNCEALDVVGIARDAARRSRILVPKLKFSKFEQKRVSGVRIALAVTLRPSNTRLPPRDHRSGHQDVEDLIEHDRRKASRRPRGESSAAIEALLSRTIGSTIISEQLLK